jgi:hypothetical protein
MGFFFFCSTHFLGLPSLIFVILSIDSRPPIQHFDFGFVSFFHLYLASLFFLSSYPTISLATGFI